MVGGTGSTLLCIDASHELGLGMLGQTGCDMYRKSVLLLGINDVDGLIFAYDGTGVAHLTTALGVEGCLGKYNLIECLVLLLCLTVAQNLFDGFLTILPQAIDFIGNFVSNVLDVMGFHGLAEQVRGIFEDIKSKITQPIEDAKNVVDSAISKIKGFFPISVGKILDNIKLPHFTVDGGKFPYGVGGEGYMPSFGVSWNAKGGIFDGPQIIGVGEAGPEAVIPLSGERVKPFAEAVANAESKDYGKLAGVIYNAVSSALANSDMKLQIGNREFGRILREAGAL